MSIINDCFQLWTPIHHSIFYNIKCLVELHSLLNHEHHIVRHNFFLSMEPIIILQPLKTGAKKLSNEYSFILFYLLISCTLNLMLLSWLLPIFADWCCYNGDL